MTRSKTTISRWYDEKNKKKKTNIYKAAAACLVRCASKIEVCSEQNEISGSSGL